MGLRNILAPRQQVQTAAGSVLAGGKVFLFEPGTTTFVTSFRDSGLVVPHTNPVRLSGSGRANIWITRDVDMFIVPRTNISDLIPSSPVISELNANPDALGVDQAGGLVPNGSFEIDSDADLVPDGYTLASEVGAVNALDTSESTDGAQSFRFTSSGIGGGSLVTDDFFPVNDADPLRINIDLRSTVVAVRNIVRVEWYDVSQIAISNTDAYDSTANPVTFTTQNLVALPPVGARFAKIRMIGIDPSVALAGSTFFDRLSVFYPAVVTGVFDNITIQNNEIITTNVNGDLNLRPNGTGAVVLDRNGVPALSTADGSINIIAPGNGDPTAADAITASLSFQSQDGNDYGRIDFGSGDPGDMIIRNFARGAVLAGSVEAAAGGELTAWSATPLSMDLYEPGDFEVRLSTALSTAPGTEAGIAIQGSLANSPTTSGVQDQILEFRNSGVERTALMGFTAGAELRIRNLVHGAPVLIESEDLAGAVRILWLGDPDGIVEIHHPGSDTVRITSNSAGGATIRSDGDTDTETRQLTFAHQNNTSRANIGHVLDDTFIVRNRIHGGIVRLAAEQAGGAFRELLDGDPDGGLSGYHPVSDAIVWRTETPANGGLEVDNQSTGAGFERVLTVSDLSGGVEKAADETTATDIVLSDDSALTLALTAGSYEVTFLLAFHGDGTGAMGIQYDVAYSGTITRSSRLLVRQLVNGSGTPGSGRIEDITQGLNFPTITFLPFQPDYVFHIGTIVVSDSGTLSIRWAQNTSNASDLVVDAGSYLKIVRLS